MGKVSAHDQNVEGPLPSGLAYGTRCEEMGKRAISGLMIGFCVAFLAILSALHALEPEFNPSNLISEYQPLRLVDVARLSSVWERLR